MPVTILALAVVALVPTRARATWPNDPGVNVPVCTAPYHQNTPKIVSDDAGGAILAWQDYRAGRWAIYAQRLGADGVVRWASGGVSLCTTPNNETICGIVSDGAGGAIVAWLDEAGSDLYAQRVNGSGVVQWATNGVAVCAATNAQTNVQMVADGAGGALFTWQDSRTGTSNIYAQRVGPTGMSLWVTNGVPVGVGVQQISPTIASDGAGGAYIAWMYYATGSWTGYVALMQHLNAAGAATWTPSGYSIPAPQVNRYYPMVVSDGAGGVIVVWVDTRSGSWQLYAMRLDVNCTLLWGTTTTVETTGLDLSAQMVVPDGQGGAVVGWTDTHLGNYDLFAQRVAPDGSLVWPWAPRGVPVCTTTSALDQLAMTPDGTGGAVFAWRDPRNQNTYDIYAQRVLANGSMPWTTNGVSVTNAYYHQHYPAISVDGLGGAIVAWQDNRVDPTYADVYAQRIELGFGGLGYPEPHITSVRDVPYDQGGKVDVEWTASALDVAPGFAIRNYSLWRRVPTTQALQSLADGSAALATVSASAEPRARTLRALRDGVQTVYWEYVVSQPARGFTGYSVVTATLFDSLPASNPRTSFMISAEQSGGTPCWNSAPDSGYSVDNLAPASPAPFTARYAGGATSLHWGRNAEADFATYRLHRGSAPSFVPGAANLVCEQPDTGYVDHAGAPACYKLCAVDVHGNASPYVLLTPDGTTGVPGAPPLALSLAPVRPNPARGGRIDVAFCLPSAGAATLELLDLAGRRIVALDVGGRSDGWRTVDLARGHVAPGLYVVRLTMGDRALTRRVAVFE